MKNSFPFQTYILYRCLFSFNTCTQGTFGRWVRLGELEWELTAHRRTCQQVSGGLGTSHAHTYFPYCTPTLPLPANTLPWAPICMPACLPALPLPPCPLPACCMVCIGTPQTAACQPCPYLGTCCLHAQVVGMQWEEHPLLPPCPYHVLFVLEVVRQGGGWTFWVMMMLTGHSILPP